MPFNKHQHLDECDTNDYYQLLDVKYRNVPLTGRVPARPFPLPDTAFDSGVNAFPTSSSRHRGAQSINMWLKLDQSKGSGDQIKSRSAVDSALTSRCAVLHMSEDTLKPSERHQITPSDARPQTALRRTSESSPWAHDCVQVVP
jgi:hypothetical protein